MCRLLLPSLLAAAGLLLPAAASAQAPEVTTLAKGLDNPRHLDVATDGTIYVAEAGKGGKRPCFVGPEGPACYGETGKITAIGARGVKATLVSKLPSYASRERPGTNAIGPSGIKVDGDSVLYTTGGPTALTQNDRRLTRKALARIAPNSSEWGRLYRARTTGRFKGLTRELADLFGFESAENPDRSTGNPAIDANPVDVLREGSSYYVADAGGNAIYRATRSGRVSAFSLLPNRDFPAPDGSGQMIPVQSVPTSIVRAPDGSFSVGELTGAPFPAAGANVYRVDAGTGEATVLQGGFTNIIDLAYADDGTLYVLQIDSNGLIAPGDDGSLIAIDPAGNRRILELPPGTLVNPGGVVVAPDGALYVTNRSTAPGRGTVVRIRP